MVARKKTGELVRGYLKVEQDPIQGQYPVSLPERFSLQLESSSKNAVLETASLKALFFVKKFTGDPDYREIKFFTQALLSEDLWVRLKFFDNEVLEGTIRNSLESFVQQGFLFRPADEASNNEALYVIKSSLFELRVLRTVDITTREQMASDQVVGVPPGA